MPLEGVDSNTIRRRGRRLAADVRQGPGPRRDGQPVAVRVDRDAVGRGRLGAQDTARLVDVRRREVKGPHGTVGVARDQGLADDVEVEALVPAWTSKFRRPTSSARW